MSDENTNPEETSRRALALTVACAETAHGRVTHLGRLAVAIRASAIGSLDDAAFAILLGMARGGHVSVGTIGECIGAARASAKALAAPAPAPTTEAGTT